MHRTTWLNNPFRTRHLQDRISTLETELASHQERKAEAASQERILAAMREQGFDITPFGNASVYPELPKTYAELVKRVDALSFNPLAHRILSIPVDLLHQHATPFQCENPEETKIIEDFWTDPINNFPSFSKQILYELGLYGEFCPTVFVNPISRKVRLGNISSFMIQSVILDPDNPRIPIGIKLYNPNDPTDKDDQILTTIVAPNNLVFVTTENPLQPQLVLNQTVEQDLFSPNTQFLRQQFGITSPETKEKLPRFCFLFQDFPRLDKGTFKYGKSLRGTSVLMPIHDWILASDDMLSSMIERADLLSRTLWTLQVEGGNLRDKDELNLDALKRRFGKIPERWEVRVTNEKMKYQRHDHPNGSSDMVELLRAIELYIITGVGLPETWFLGGINSNKASSQNMEFPTLKRLESQQHTINHIWNTLFLFVVTMAGMAPTFKVVSTPLKDSTQQVLAESLRILGESLTNAQTQNWLSPQEAGTIYRKLVQDLGIKLGDIPKIQTPSPGPDVSL